MSISSKFSVAVHILLLIADSGETLSSSRIASSVNTNPVVIRRLIGIMQKRNLITGYQGKKGYTFLKKPEDITLLDVYRSVSDADSKRLFSFHENPNPNCKVGANIQGLLEGSITAAQVAMEEVLKETTIEMLLKKMTTMEK